MNIDNNVEVVASSREISQEQVKFVDALYYLAPLHLILPMLAYMAVAKKLSPNFDYANIEGFKFESFNDFIADTSVKGLKVYLKNDPILNIHSVPNTTIPLYEKNFSEKYITKMGKEPSLIQDSINRAVKGKTFTRREGKVFKNSIPILGNGTSYYDNYTPFVSDLVGSLSSAKVVLETLVTRKDPNSRSTIEVASQGYEYFLNAEKGILESLSRLEKEFGEDIYRFDKSVMGSFDVDFGDLAKIGLSLEDFIEFCLTETDYYYEFTDIGFSDGGFDYDETFVEDDPTNPQNVAIVRKQLEKMLKTFTVISPPIANSNVGYMADYLTNGIYVLNHKGKKYTNLTQEGSEYILNAIGAKKDGNTLVMYAKNKIDDILKTKDDIVLENGERLVGTDIIDTSGLDVNVVKMIEVVRDYDTAKKLLNKQELAFYKTLIALARFGNNKDLTRFNVDIDIPQSLASEIIGASNISSNEGLVNVNEYMNGVYSNFIVADRVNSPPLNFTTVRDFNKTESRLSKNSELRNSPNNLYVNQDGETFFIPEDFTNTEGYYKSLTEAVDAEPFPIAASTVSPFRHSMTTSIVGKTMEETKEVLSVSEEKRRAKAFNLVARNLNDSKLAVTNIEGELTTIDISGIRPLNDAMILNLLDDPIFKMGGGSTLAEDYRTYLNRMWEIYEAEGGTFDDLIPAEELANMMIVGGSSSDPETIKHKIMRVDGKINSVVTNLNYERMGQVTLVALLDLSRTVINERIRAAKVKFDGMTYEDGSKDDYVYEELDDFDYNPFFGESSYEREGVSAGSKILDIESSKWHHVYEDSNIIALRFIARLAMSVSKIVDNKGFSSIAKGSVEVSMHFVAFTKMIAYASKKGDDNEHIMKTIFKLKTKHNTNKQKVRQKALTNPTVNVLGGVTEGYGMLPHQARIDDVLHNINDDYMENGFANATLLDVKAGGGKTHIIWIDVARKLEEKLITKPLIICPDYLISNYVEDGNYIFKGKYNIVAIDNQNIKNYKTDDGQLGYDGIKNIVDTAPRNTLFVCGYNFLSIPAYEERGCGAESYWVNLAVEMLLSCNFDYIGADESHVLRNRTSNVSQCASLLFASIKYKVLATGTFMNTRPNDIPNQFGLLDPTVFINEDTFAKRYAQGVSRGKITTLTDEAKMQISTQLTSQSNYISAKRKEWAVTLPKRIDTYYTVDLGKDTLHSKLYQAVFALVIEDIKAALNGKGLEDKIDESGLLDEETAQSNERLLNPYLARLETILTAPQHDVMFKEIYGDLDEEEIASAVGITPPTAKCIEIIKHHIYGMPVDVAQARNKGLKNKSPDNPSLINITDEDIAHGSLPPVVGKILVVCNQRATAKAVYDALPPDLKEMALHYKSGDKAKYILEFKKNDKYQIMIGVGSSLSTGHNFQMASRIIRVDAVWAPGQVEQLESRINRPDPKGDNAKREACYFDWIIVNGTISATKTARLVSRMLLATMLDEANNPNYELVEQLPLIKADLGTIQEVCWLIDPDTPDSRMAGMAASLGDKNLYHYLAAKNNIDTIQYREVEEYKLKTGGIISAIEVPSKPVDNDYKYLVGQPFIPNQTLPLSNELGFQTYVEFVNNATDNDPEAIKAYDPKGLYVMTSEGDGIVVSSTANQVKVKIKGVVRNVYKNTVLVNPNKIKQEQLIAEIGLPAIDVSGKAVTVGKKTKQEIPVIDTRPTEIPVKQTTVKERDYDKPAPDNDIEEEIENDAINLYASILNGMPSVSVSLEDPDVSENVSFFQDLGFVYNPDYYSVLLDRVLKVDRLIEALEAFQKKGVKVSNISMKELYRVRDLFVGRGSQMFAQDQIEASELKNYLATKRKALAADRIRPMIIIEDGYVYCTLDARDPAVKKFLRKPIQGVKFELYEGYLFKPYTTKKSAAPDIKEIRSYFDITNYEEFKQDFKDMKITRSKT